MTIILVNYRYYVSGGPEVYLFAVKALLESASVRVVPFSVESPRNVPDGSGAVFVGGRGGDGEAKFDEIKKTPRSLARLFRGAVYNPEAERALRALIRREKPDAVYVLQQVNALSPSVFEACRKERVRLVHRLSDFNLMCPRFDFLRAGAVCTECIGGRYAGAIANRCVKGSLPATLVRVFAMKLAGAWAGTAGSAPTWRRRPSPEGSWPNRASIRGGSSTSPPSWTPPPSRRATAGTTSSTWDVSPRRRGWTR